MGIAILGGIIASLNEAAAATSSADTSAPADLPPRLPTKFIACVRRKESAKRIENELAAYNADLTTLVGNNLEGAKASDVLLLGCKPYMFREVLGEPGLKELLKGKLLISILAGVSVQQIEEFLYKTPSNNDPFTEGRCRIVRAMPNTAAAIRQSMTVIAHSTPPLAEDEDNLLTWMFSRIGRVTRLPPTSFDACTAICGSGPAFMALVLEAAADGAVAMGIPRAEAQTMAAQAMYGASGMVLGGEHPAIFRDKVSTPGGCTIGGLLVLEENNVRGAMARAVREATVVASQLGKGVQGVNGTRF